MSLTLTRNDLSNEFDEALTSDSVITPEFAVSGVVRALVSHFGSEVRIYKEEAPQDYNAPAFFVYEVDGQRNKKHQNNYNHLYAMQVRYELEDGLVNVQQTLRDISSELYECLDAIMYPNFDGYNEEGEIIETNRPIRSKNMNNRIEDGVLFFDFTIDLNLIRTYKMTDRMDSLELNINKEAV